MNTRPLVLAGLIAGSLLAADVSAQSQADLQSRKDKKLAEDWVQNSPWILDYTVAKAASKETGKPIFAYFTRSYAP